MSPVLVRAVRSISVSYRFASPTKRGWSRVDAPDSSSRSPVANGSSVPAWPVRALVFRRVAATMANDVGPAGLSTRMIPLG